jgi:uncharacterized membrane protein (DUF485 family)
MTQVYMDKVLINQENPPKLSNFILMFAILDILMMLIIVVIISLTSKFLPTVLKGNLDLKVIGIDFGIYLLLTSVIGYIIADAMYNKKFFMYKDDGLRAIRAFKDIILYISICLSIFPFFLIKIN